MSTDRKWVVDIYATPAGEIEPVALSLLVDATDARGAERHAQLYMEAFGASVTIRSATEVVVTKLGTWKPSPTSHSSSTARRTATA